MKKIKQFCLILLVLTFSVTTLFAAGAKEAASTVPTIGFTNMADSIDFCMLVKNGMKSAVEARGWKFVAYDNELDGQKAVQNTDQLIQRKVDYAVIFNIDAATQPVVSQKLKEAGIPAMAIDIYLPDFPFFGVDNHLVGRMGGEYIGKWALENWGKEPDLYVILDNPMGGQYAMDRSNACEDGLLQVFPNYPKSKMVRVDAKADVLEAKKVMADVLTANPRAKNIAVTGINDQVCAGGFAALEEAGRDKDSLVVSLGADTSFLQHLNATQGKSAWKAAVLFGPEKYGEQIAAQIEKVFAGETLPEEIHVNSVIIDESSLATYYPEWVW